MPDTDFVPPPVEDFVAGSGFVPPSPDDFVPPHPSTEIKSSTPFTDRAVAFLGGAGIPTSIKGLKEAGKFLIRSPIQDVKDIAKGVSEIPERIRNLGQTLRGSPAATVARAPLSTEAFGVYGTAAGMLAPGLLKDKLPRGGEVTDAEKPDTQTGGLPAEQGQPPVQQTESQVQTGDPRNAPAQETVAEPFLVDQDGNVVEQGGESDAIQRSQESGQGQRGETRPDQEKDEGGVLEQGGVQPPAESGISTERLQEVYGPDNVIINKGKSAKEWKEIGQADTRDPYEVLSQSRRSGIAKPEDAPLFRAEHQRLLERARAAYGTPEYPQLARYAVDFANATKQVVHGPASDLMRGLQEADAPRYDSPADFDNIVRERMGRESTPDQMETFTKASDELRNGDREVESTVSVAQKKLRQYRPKDVISYADATKSIREQIKELTHPCEL